MASKLGWETEDIVTTVVALGGGWLLYRLAARGFRVRRANALAAVDARLRELAADMGGQFRPGPALAMYRRVLGDARAYGSALVTSHGLAVEVGVIFPGDHPFEDQTTIRVQLPSRIPTSTRAAAGLQSLAGSASLVEVTADGEQLLFIAAPSVPAASSSELRALIDQVAAVARTLA